MKTNARTKYLISAADDESGNDEFRINSLNAPLAAAAAPLTPASPRFRSSDLFPQGAKSSFSAHADLPAFLNAAANEQFSPPPPPPPPRRDIRLDIIRSSWHALWKLLRSFVLSFVRPSGCLTQTPNGRAAPTAAVAAAAAAAAAVGAMVDYQKLFNPAKMALFLFCLWSAKIFAVDFSVASRLVPSRYSVVVPLAKTKRTTLRIALVNQC